MCSVCPRFSCMTITPGTRPLTLGFATYAMSEAPSAALIRGFETAMRGSFSITVMPSVVAAGGGVANGCATRPGDDDAVTVAVGVPVERGLRSQAARSVVAAAALPTTIATLRMSSRRAISPSRKSSMCSSTK